MGTGNGPLLAFGEAVTVTLKEMAGIDAVLTGSERTRGARYHGVSTLLHLHNGGNGFLALCCPVPVATELARRVLAGTAQSVDGTMAQDCVGEVANVIAGQAKTRLYGTPDHFTFSPPEVAAVPAEPGTERWVFTFASEIGEFTVHVRLPHDGG